MASNLNIPFGAVDGVTARSDDYDVSIGKLFAGGTAIYLFSQNKIKKTSISKTKYASCANWIVVGIKESGVISTQSEPSGDTYPLESANVSFQEDTNIIWAPVQAGGTPVQITSGVNINDIAPATAVDCIVFLGYNANFSVSVKGPKDILGAYEPSNLFKNGLGVASFPPTPAWNRGNSRTMQRTDWQVITATGKGYNVGGNDKIQQAAVDIDATMTRDQNSINGAAKSTYYQLTYTANARGDCTSSCTKFDVRKTAGQ